MNGVALKWGLMIFLLMPFALSSFAYSQSDRSYQVSLADTNRFGNLVLYDYPGWQFSPDAPPEIKDQRNLNSTRPVDIRNLKELKEGPGWNNYGWFELELNVDSTLVGIPWILSHRGHEPVKVWLNGVLVLTNGNPSKNPEEEKLSRFINNKQAGVMFREGSNYILFEYSDHTAPIYFSFWQWFESGVHLILYKQYEPFMRRHRAFMFGGTLMLLTLLVLIHVYLAVKFKGKYHTYVSLTTFSMLVLAFTTLSDTLFNWSYSYIYFYEFSYVISLVFIVYFFLISVRMIFNLSVPWKSLTIMGIIFIVLGVASIYVNRAWLNTIHPTMIIATLLYVFYSLWQAKKQDPDSKIGVLATGILATILGAFLYTGVYIAFNIDIHSLFILSVLLSFTGIPVLLTFNVARNYADLIYTLEMKVRERTADLEAANSYQNRFFANISHEFRTPLTISEGLINKMIRSKEADSSKHQYDLSVVKRNMTRLHDMVNQIIDLTKADQDHLTLNKKYYKADNLAYISVESFRSLAEYHGHRFEFFPNAGDAILHADRLKVEVMINNLISNAIKFTPEAGAIEIRTSVKDDRFTLTVQDTGPGIPDDEKEAIFQRFHRIKRDDADYVEGMGVGLELSRTLAKLHSGNITVDTTIETGAFFILNLPITEIPESKITPVLETPDENLLNVQKALVTTENGTNFDILLVEDNEDMMEYVSDILSELGTIKKARNGKEALEVLNGYTPDIIVADLMMPVMGGLELVETLKNHKKWNTIPVMVLTAKALEESKLHLLRIGVVDYITKPFLSEQLVLKVKNLLVYYTRRKAIRLKVKAEEIPETTTLSEKAADFIFKNLSATSLSVEMLADQFSQSRRSFYRNLKLETGMSPGEFIREVRLTSARAMVANNNNIRLEELATAVGYKNATSFRKVYEERFGEHPLG